MASEGEQTGGEDTPSHTRARTVLTVEERVAHIVGMMERLEWVRGKSGKVLAEEWGLSVSTVESHSAEAHRRIVGDKDDAVRDITAGARQLMQRALAAGDPRGFTAVANLLADVAGAKAPTKQEIDARVSEGPSPAEAARLVREQFGEKAAKVDDGGPIESVPEATEG